MATFNGINNTSYPLSTTLATATGLTLDAGTNTLSNYLEGASYTPTVSFNGGTTGMSATTGGNYSRIGNMVFFTAWFTFTAKGSSTGSLRLTLPLTAYNSQGGFSCRAVSIIAQTWVNGFVDSSNSYLVFYASDSNGTSWLEVTNTHCANDSSITCSGFYFV
jgi:hypothetical protein